MSGRMVIVVPLQNLIGLKMQDGAVNLLMQMVTVLKTQQMADATLAATVRDGYFTVLIQE